MNATEPPGHRPAAASARPRWRLRLGLRWTLLIALAPLLTLPWVGLRFVDRMSELMRNERLDNLSTTAASLAATLHERRTLFDSAPQRTVLPAGAQALPIALLARVGADPRDDEWADVARQTLPVSLRGDAAAGTLTVRVAVARSQEQPGQLYIRIDADDERLVAARDDSGAPAPGDTVRIDAGHSPDALRPTVVVAQPDPPRLVAREGGWSALVVIAGDPALLRIQVEDIDYLGSRKLEAVADSGLLAPARPLAGPDTAASRAMEQAWADAARALERVPGRVTVHDPRGALLYRHDPAPAKAHSAPDWSARLARSILAAASRAQPDRWFAGERRGAPPPQDGRPASATPARPLSPLASALAGTSAAQAQRVGDGAGLPAWRLVSAHPIWIGEQVAGALTIEEDTAERHAPAQRALERLALLAALAVSATVGTLLMIATLTVGRIVRLRNQAEAAIDARGRVVGSIAVSRLGDELSDLGAGYQRVLDRLREHQEYLGNLRSRLVHELRTPIMVVRSSLENLAAVDDPAQRSAYLERVRSGAERLEKVVSSMGEAASLEAMLAGSRLETVDLTALIEGCARGYRGAFAGQAFEFDSDGRPRECAVVPEAVVQALDKLVSNAVDFAAPGTPIRLSLQDATLAPASGRTRSRVPAWSIAVANDGPALPGTMQASLFDSMVSVRAERGDGRTHLGLGLYLVRLIAEFHGGYAFAANRPGGVQVGLVLRKHA
ncbi:MAG: hypothetical protein KA169_13180 [Burkholderiaceae bacterium]|nr:hypothetical protein [Burkholderiaceae bacterium]